MQLIYHDYYFISKNFRLFPIFRGSSQRQMVIDFLEE